MVNNLVWWSELNFDITQATNAVDRADALGLGWADEVEQAYC